MKKMLLISMSIVFLSNSIYGMKRNELVPAQNQGQICLWLPEEIIINIAGYCEPQEKNILAKLCKDFLTALKNRELVVQANPFTVYLKDKLKSMFTLTALGDTQKLPVWLDAINITDQHAEINDIDSINDDEGITALSVATKNKNIPIIQILLKHGAHINAKDDSDSSSLNYAPDIDTARVLIDAGADVNIGDSNLCIATKRNDIKLVKLLLCNRIKINQQNNMLDSQSLKTSLEIACKEGYVDIVKLLLCAGAKKEDGCLDAVAKNGHCDIAKLLIKDYGSYDFDGMPLYRACKYGQTAMVQLLISCPMDINYIGDYDNTPLHIAAEKGHVEIVDLLLNLGADQTRENINGHTPLHLARKKKHGEVIKILIANLFNELQSPQSQEYTDSQTLSEDEEDTQDTLNKI
jgi:ankyrin repeat protein